MKVTVKQQVKTMQEVEVELPYFYRYDLELDAGNSVIYGRIDERDHFSVQVSENGRRASVEFEREATCWGSLACYLDCKYRSSQTEYEEAKAKALEFAK